MPFTGYDTGRSASQHFAFLCKAGAAVAPPAWGVRGCDDEMIVPQTLPHGCVKPMLVLRKQLM